MKYGIDDFPLVLERQPQGNLRRSDMNLEAYAEKLELENGKGKKTVVFHFVGSGLSQVRSCDTWSMSPCENLEAENEDGTPVATDDTTVHIRCDPKPGAKVEVNSVYLFGKDGDVGFKKERPGHSSHKERHCRRGRVSAH